jgi:hypothetical protein
VPETTARALYLTNNAIGKLFSMEKTIICIVHNISFWTKKKKPSSILREVHIAKKYKDNAGKCIRHA